MVPNASLGSTFELLAKILESQDLHIAVLVRSSGTATRKTIQFGERPTQATVRQWGQGYNFRIRTHPRWLELLGRVPINCYNDDASGPVVPAFDAARNLYLVAIDRGSESY